eukprot:3354037-Rhodomonas_salina.1
MEGEAGNAPVEPPQENPGNNEQQPVPERSNTVRRLHYDCVEGTARKLKILTACMQFKSTLFGTGKRSDTYNMIATDMNKYFPDLFCGILKDTGVQSVWNTALKDADAQKKSMDEELHKWFNGNVLREMSELEVMLSEIHAEKAKVEQKKEADKAADAAEEADARKRKNAAIDRVGERYDAGNVVHPDDRDAAEEEGDDSFSSPKSASSGSYGCGTREGNNKKAGGNPGLSPDAKPDKLTEACAEQGEIAEQIANLAEKIGKDVDDQQDRQKRAREENTIKATDEAAAMNAKAQKLQATAALC